MAGDKHRVVIVGGGFGGLYAAKALRRRSDVEITLIDRRNHHVFQPLLYQVATAALNPSEIATPIRKILRGQKNARVVLGEVVGIDAPEKKVLLDGGAIPYDSLILAAGATHSYFGNNEWAVVAPGLKSIEDAVEIRRRVLLAYEAAELTASDPALRAAWLTFVVVGAGPTGVEMAGALKEIATHALRRDFRDINPAEARVILLEGADRVLPPYVPELSEEARLSLRALGVEVRTGARVTHIDDSGVQIGPERIAAKTVIWAAGVAASPLARSLGVPLDRAGRVLVQPDLTIKEYPEIFVVGDLAAASEDGKPIPGVAGAAVQGGQHAAKSIIRRLEGQPVQPFHYVDKGSLATIGRAAAVADFGRIKMHGFVAWLAWLFIHVFLLIGFKNRVMVILQWAWSYFTYERGARLITGDTPPLLGPAASSVRTGVAALPSPSLSAQDGAGVRAEPEKRIAELPRAQVAPD